MERLVMIMDSFNSDYNEEEPEEYQDSICGWRMTPLALPRVRQTSNKKRDYNSFTKVIHSKIVNLHKRKESSAKECVKTQLIPLTPLQIKYPVKTECNKKPKYVVKSSMHNYFSAARESTLEAFLSKCKVQSIRAQPSGMKTATQIKYNYSISYNAY